MPCSFIHEKLKKFCNIVFEKRSFDVPWKTKSVFLNTKPKIFNAFCCLLKDSHPESFHKIPFEKMEMLGKGRSWKKITTLVFDQGFHRFTDTNYFRSACNWTFINIFGSSLPAGSNKTQTIDIHWQEEEIIWTNIWKDSNTIKNAKTTN